VNVPPSGLEKIHETSVFTTERIIDLNFVPQHMKTQDFHGRNSEFSGEGTPFHYILHSLQLLISPVPEMMAIHLTLKGKEGWTLV